MNESSRVAGPEHCHSSSVHVRMGDQDSSSSPHTTLGVESVSLTNAAKELHTTSMPWGRMHLEELLIRLCKKCCYSNSFSEIVLFVELKCFFHLLGMEERP